MYSEDEIRKKVDEMLGKTKVWDEAPETIRIPKNSKYIPENAKRSTLPIDAKMRKAAPIASGVLDYFPDALFAVAELSKIGNEQHNPGKPLHWDKTKSMDHADCILRHLIDRGTVDTDGVRHSAKVAWRSLALLQIEIEKERNNV